MSVIKISIIAATLIMSTAALAESPNRIYSAGDNSYASKLCVVAATGNRIQVTDQIKALKPTTQIKRNYRYVVNKITCNGIDIVSFAVNAGNYGIAEKLVKYRSGNVQINDLAAVSVDAIEKNNGVVIIAGM